MWRSVGFLMSFAVVLEGMSLVSFFVVLSGGKRLRESGWKVLSLLILLSAVVQIGSVSLVVFLPFLLFFLQKKEKDRSMKLMKCRPIYTTTKTGSLPGGSWMSRGCIALSRGRSVFSALGR